MTIKDTIKSRRSIRQFTDKEIHDDSIAKILESAKWAPSGLNNQPWRFVIIRDGETKSEISELTHYKNIMIECNLAIAVFYNQNDAYNRDKDLMSIGASIQNMLLQAHDDNIGSVWLGEILKSKNKVSEILQINSENELVAVIALGYSEEKPLKDRKDLSDLILKRI